MAHQVWISAATDRKLDDEGDLFNRGEQYHIHSHAEVPPTIDYLPAHVVANSMANTLVVADRCQASLVELPPQAIAACQLRRRRQSLSPRHVMRGSQTPNTFLNR
jgi:DNA polymerase III alpha subunit